MILLVLVVKAAVEMLHFVEASWIGIGLEEKVIAQVGNNLIALEVGAKELEGADLDSILWLDVAVKHDLLSKLEILLIVRHHVHYVFGKLAHDSTAIVHANAEVVGRGHVRETKLQLVVNPPHDGGWHLSFCELYIALILAFEKGLIICLHTGHYLKKWLFCASLEHGFIQILLSCSHYAIVF